MNNTIWTIGHSTRTGEHFIEVLKNYNIQVLVDIRTLPGSDKFPQFNQDRLSESLSQNGIEYVYIPRLGGLRPSHKDSPNIAWRNKSFRAYADYMETDAFKEGIKELLAKATFERTAMMCSEILWWRCHRSMVSDYLKSMGWTVIHIEDTGKSKEHPYTSAASIINGHLDYTQVK
ncbi:MAG: DUF488 family protein [Bacteroidales bacterium]